MELFEQGIRQRLSSEYLIGCYFETESIKGFKDIRGGEGEPIEIDGIDEIIISYEGAKLIEGEYYRFNWTVPVGSTKIKVVGEATLVDKDSFLDTLFDFHLNTRGGMLNLAVNSQESTLEEVTGSSHTFLYELLQNANDYPYNKEFVKVKFILTDHYLFFFHTGAEFSLRNIAALCTIRQGEKRKNTETIGYKGIGFKTVFVKNEYVFLESGGWHFRFDREYSEAKMFGKCAWTMMPIKMKVEELDEEARTAIQNAGKDYRVKFALRHKTDASENLAQIDKVFSDSQILLFIPNLDSVEVVVPGRNPQLVRKDLDNWVIDRYPYKIPDDLKKWVAQNIKDGGKVPPKFIELNNIHISFAVPREGKFIRPLSEARVYNYLPTDLNIGLGALINADFIPNGSRNGLHDVEWNNRVMKEVGRIFVSWWASLFEEYRGLDLNSVVGLLPPFTLTGQYPKDFKSGFDEAIRTERCIPTLRNGVYDILPLDGTVYDEIGLTTGENAALSDEEFYSLTGMNNTLPHPEIRQNPKLGRVYKDYPDRGQRFDINKLRSCIQQTEFQKWLLVKANNIRFLRFLTKRNLLSHVCSENVFLTTSGNLCRAGQLYLDIDKYVEDIGFLPDSMIQRLDPEVRTALSQESNWSHFTGNFKTFNATMFMKGFDWHSIHELLKIKVNSVGMLHYMAKHVGVYDLPNDYPLFSDSDEVFAISEDIYIPSEFGQTVREQPWFNPEEMPFIAKEYLEKDQDDVVKYLSKSSHGVYPVRASSFYSEFLQNETQMIIISRKLSEFSNNKSFYLFLSRIKDYDIRFTTRMREVYSLYCTDGNEEYYLNVGAPIYFPDSSWNTGRTEPWIPARCCSALSSSYYTGLSSEEKEELEQFLKSKQLVQSFSIAEFSRREVIPHLDEICEKIVNKEQSYAFLDFLFTNRKSVFGDSNPTSAFYSIPVFCDGDEECTSRRDNRNGIYYHGKEIDELLAQPWCSSIGVPVLDSFYDRLFDGNERIAFYQYLGFIKFSLLPFLHRTVFNNVASLSHILSDRDTNIAFHRYFCEKRALISYNELEHLQDAPIFLASSTEELGVLSNSSTKHYLPSEELTTIISSDIVPIEMLDSIHPDYIREKGDVDYFAGILKNVSLSTDQFIDRLCDSEETVTKYLKQDIERNIRFWRWAVSAKSEKRNKLRVFPILGHRYEEEAEVYTTPDTLSLSNKYSSIANFESVVHRFNPSALFVSEKYIDDDETKKWISLFKAVRVTTEDKDLVFNRIIPHLGEMNLVEIIPMISRYADDIANAIRNGDKELKSNLSHLRLKCVDGAFREVTETIITGRFLGIDIIPIPEIEIASFVSEQYLDDSEAEGESGRYIKSLFGVLSDLFKNGLETATELRDYKIGYYAENHAYQRSLATKDQAAHYRLIGELADEWYNDRVGVGEKLKGGHLFCVITKDGEQSPSYDTYLGSAYNPDCDFERNGVNYIGSKPDGSPVHYLSEEYLRCSQHIKEFLTHSSFYVIDSFHEEFLPLLSQPLFSRYFWTEYAPVHEYNLVAILTEENLRNLSCIPTIDGVKKPSELYDYRVADLKRMVTMLAAPLESTALPAINLPEWLKDTRIGFKGRLSFTDCINYLKLNKHDYRRRVYDWLTEMGDRLSPSQIEILSEYRKDGLWFNGKKEWVPIDSLVALEWGNKTLLNYFSSSESVCNPSYLPEDRFTYNALCELLSIPIITNDDFEKTKDGEVDNEAIFEIGKRLLYVAYKENPKDWELQYEKYMEFLRSAEICTCSTIEYRYNEHIKAKMKSYCEEDNCLWYVGKWNGPLFARILDWLKRVLKLTCETSMLESIFLDDYNEILSSYEESLPDRFIERLSEEDSKGLKVSSEEVIAEFNESYDEDSHVESHVQENIVSDNNSDSVDSSSDASGQAKAQNASDRETVKTESKVKGHTEVAHKTKTSAPQKSTINQSAPSETEPQKQSIEDKLASYWEEKQSSEIRKPKQARPNNVDSSNEEMGETKAKESSVPQFTKATSTSAQGAVSSSRTESDLKRKATEASNAAEKAQENFDLLELINDTEEYTFLWFKYIMRLMFGESRKATVREFQVDFLTSEIVDNHSFTLRTPSKPIPGWLEDADYLTVLPLQKGKKKIPAKVLLVKEDYLYLTIDQEAGVNLRGELDGVEKFRVNASGSTLSIDDCLETRFIQLGYDDDYNLSDNLPSNIQYIYGPPGTGKTTWLTKRIVAMVEESMSPLDILILTPTNKAADVIAEMLLASEASQWLYRFGTTERESLIEAGKVVTRDDDFWHAGEHHIVVTTAARFTYDNISGDDICEMDWDNIIVDEASMIDLVTATFILHKGKCEQFYIAGDPKQIQPVKQNDYQPENIYNMVGLDSFSEAQRRDDVTTLDIQHRSVPAIGHLVSTFAYDGKVKPERKVADAKPLCLSGFNDIRPINFVGFTTEPLDDLYGLDSVDGSAVHVYSAIFTYNFAEYISNEISKNHEGKEYTIGIVCPYRSEANVIKQMLENRSIDNANCRVSCGTVHSFQGDQCDIMLVVLNPPASCTKGTHINNGNIINVAMSRARDYVFFMIPDSPIDGFRTRELLWSLAEPNSMSLYSCADIEKIMFGKSDYIARNTNVTCHMPVNVYYEPARLYDVKIDETAVDIQINEDLRE